MSDRLPRLNAPAPELLLQLTEIVGPANAIIDPDIQAPYLREWRDRYVGRTPVVLRPQSTDEVARILALVNAAHVGVVPQGGNTGLVGGQIPSETGREIVLSLTRLNRIRAVDQHTSSMTVEAGVTLAAARAAAEAAGRLFPLSLPSEGTCSIGGNLATNAGGIGVLAHGNARQLTLGIEAVLADGRIWNGLKALRKDNTGYDLRDLLIGSEGTLGIITAATLKLVSRPREVATALAALPSLDAVLSLFELASNRGGASLTAFEFLSQRSLHFVTRHVAGARLPFDAEHPWYVLLDISGHADDGGALAVAEAIFTSALDARIVKDAIVAQSLTQSAALWQLREGASEAQKFEGGSIKHDVSVPVGSIPAFIAHADALIEALCPGARPVAFGHFGDGNVHYNVSQPLGMDRAEFLEKWEEISAAVHALVTRMDGSISAEHGIGQMKRASLRSAKSAVELDMMRAIKAALDPHGILNPGKLL
ncbi:MAG: FAD-binding oxidoreductase [Hyphomicrobiaceae bacterium]|nr:FAD-binding oxidoreductase [Hyphomicrobiaceae bacterium]